MGERSEQQAKEILLERILQHEPLFSRFLLTLRDSFTSDVEMSHGESYGTKDFLDRVGTNLVSMDVIRSWGYFFGLTYDYKLQVEKTVLRKLILTCFVAKTSEIIEFLANAQSGFAPKILDTLEWNPNKKEAVVNILLKLGLNRNSERTRNLMIKDINSLARSSGVILFDREEKSILLARRTVGSQDFKKTVLESYRKILADLGVYAPISVPIEELRAETCEKLHISGELFDSALIGLHEEFKEYVWLVGASRAMRRRAAREKHIISGKPLKYNNQYFFFVTLVWEKIT